MKHSVLLIAATLFFFAGCSKKATDAEQASQYVQQSHELVEQGDLNSAKSLLDSVHVKFPKCVAQRRLAQSLQDSIVFIEAQRTAAYSDSLLQIVLPQIDPVMKKFVYEKEEKYEDHGRYVHRLLRTTSNIARCYLQTYVSDDRTTTVKSHFYGAGVLDQTAIQLESNGEELMLSSSLSHGYEAEGYHSILTFETEQALSILNFVSSHQADRLRVKILGTNKQGNETTYIYYLTDNEKIALQDSYQLGILMNDIKTLEDALRKANMQIERYHQKYGML